MMNIRNAREEDREPLKRLLEATGIFSQAEIQVAMELIEESLQGSPDYLLALADLPEMGVAGFVCYGLNPVTDAFYDLYWIAVHPKAQRKQVGKRLMEWMEGDIRKRGGRGICIETSSREEYKPARKLYERCGYSPAATFHDFYKPGDHQIVYTKYLTGN